jgi:propionyl-CoA carboxylase beta chain
MNIVIGLCPLRRSSSIGIVANQPAMLAGVPRYQSFAERPRDSCASAIVSIFHCVTFEDVPGFLPGTDQEWNGIIHQRRQVALCLLPRLPFRSITVITRKAYGGAYDVMASETHPVPT